MEEEEEEGEEEGEVKGDGMERIKKRRRRRKCVSLEREEVKED